MKKILVFLLVVFIFSSCSFDVMQDSYIKKLIGYQELYYHPDFDSLDSYRKISDYIQKKVSYDYDDNHEDIKNPYDTLTSGKGSCADYAVLFMNIAYYGMGIKMNLVIVNTNQRLVVEGGTINHSVVSYQNEIIEPQNGTYVNYSIRYIYTFDEVFD